MIPGPFGTGSARPSLKITPRSYSRNILTELSKYKTRMAMTTRIGVVNISLPSPSTDCTPDKGRRQSQINRAIPPVEADPPAPRAANTAHGSPRAAPRPWQPAHLQPRAKSHLPQAHGPQAQAAP